ncbi:YfcE family phosphodiesterase [Sulfurimonas sp. C5]|uniref:YfcE family phosphodiesterase n=1 Tax=Sulfurimonas sp. C5 TaxID=3036947 RepID=UPI0024589F62|nr:YfcE family phosphodiesterase [Sulfurimonas sp. C5]MDH4944759.1 YfcE family phosphodiesterase [Sulfurimonas sp. C5]
MKRLTRSNSISDSIKIGIISDSHTKHNRAVKAIDMLLKEGVEFFIHAGDIVEAETLEYLKKTKKRYVAVYGNNDAHLVDLHNKYNLVQEPNYFKLANTTFKLMHLPFYMSNDTDIVIFGHTHKFEVEYKGKTLYLNPGEVCARNKPSSECVLLEITPEKFDVKYFTRKKKEEFQLEEEYSFQRE